MSELSEVAYRAIVEGSPIAKLLVDRTGRIVLVNKQLESLFGYRRDELLGNSVEMLVPKLVRDRHPALRDEYFKDPQPRYMGVGRDLMGTKKDGSDFPVEIALAPIQTESGTLVVANITDITDRKRSEERFRAVVEAAPAAMVMIDVNGKIVLANTMAEGLFGYARQELLGSAIEILVPMRIRDRHPAMRDGFFADPAPRMMGVGRDLSGVRKDGTEFPVEIGLNPIETSEGRFAIAAIVDITERLDRERLLQRQRDEIRQLSTPILEVWDRVIVLPIIGTLDADRSRQLTESLLLKIASDKARFVVLDVSGVTTIDSHVAQNLLATVASTRLMGSECLLSGIRAETAQTLTHLGIDLGDVRSVATLRDALEMVLRDR